MPKVMTVRGPIEPDTLGVTYAHEHLLGGPPDWSADAKDTDLIMLSAASALKELELFQLAGGHAMVEMSTPDYRRSPEGLCELSVNTGIHIIMTTGYHKDVYSNPLTEAATIEELTAVFVRDLTAGVGEAGIRAGVVKGATSLNRITVGENKLLRAAARTQLETGAPISTHTQAGTMGLEQIAVFQEEGVDPSRVAIGHVDRKQEYDYHRAARYRRLHYLRSYQQREVCAGSRSRGHAQTACRRGIRRSHHAFRRFWPLLVLDIERRGAWAYLHLMAFCALAYRRWCVQGCGLGNADRQSRPIFRFLTGIS